MWSAAGAGWDSHLSASSSLTVRGQGPGGLTGRAPTDDGRRSLSPQIIHSRIGLYSEWLPVSSELGKQNSSLTIAFDGFQPPVSFGSLLPLTIESG